MARKIGLKENIEKEGIRVSSSTSFSKKRIILTGIAALIIVLLIFFILVPYINISKAHGMYTDEKYAAAATIYSKYINNFAFGKKAAQGYREAKIRIAEQAFEAGEYYTAIEIYANELNDDALANTARIKAGDSFLEESNYSRAIYYYKQAGDQERISGAYITLGDNLLAQNDFEGAVSAYSNASAKEKENAAYIAWGDYTVQNRGSIREIFEYYVKGQKYKSIEEGLRAESDLAFEIASEKIKNGNTDDISTLNRYLTGDRVAKLVFEVVEHASADATSQQAIDAAHEYGKTIKDTNTQLIFCNILLEHGFDLKQVYPNGVEVDEDLSEYQIFNLNDNNTGKLNYNKVLVFSRVESLPSLEPVNSTSPLGDKVYDQIHSKKTIKQYTSEIRIHPELMVDLSTQNQAWSKEEATCVLLLESGYTPTGYLSIHRMNISARGVSNSEYNTYVAYSAYNSFVLYNKDEPTECIALHVNYTEPLADNGIVCDADNATIFNLTYGQIDVIQAAISAGRYSREYFDVVKKYGQKNVDLVDSHNEGDYVLFPESNNPNESRFLIASTDDISAWNKPKYMIGALNESWISEQIEDGIMTEIAFYIYIYSLG